MVDALESVVLLYASWVIQWNVVRTNGSRCWKHGIYILKLGSLWTALPWIETEPHNG